MEAPLGKPRGIFDIEELSISIRSLDPTASCGECARHACSMPAGGKTLKKTGSSVKALIFQRDPIYSVSITYSTHLVVFFCFTKGRNSVSLSCKTPHQKEAPLKIKKITIHGFKSFVDKVTLNLSSGTSGIIGPNGCGKSNIVA